MPTSVATRNPAAAGKSMPPQDACNTIKCAPFCEAECGWSRPLQRCVAGLTTEASEKEERLGDCPDKPTSASNDGDGTDDAATTTTTVIIVVVVCIAVVAVVGILAHCCTKGRAPNDRRARAVAEEPSTVHNDAYDEPGNDDGEAYEPIAPRGIVASLDGAAYADVAAVLADQAGAGYEQPSSTYT